MKKILFLILVFAGLISSAQTPIPDSLKSKVVLGSMLWLKYNGATWDTLGLFPDSIPSIWSNSGKIGVDTIYFKDDGTKQWTAASGTGGSDTGYVKTTGDSIYSNYTSFNGSWLWTGTTGATPASGAGTRMMWIPAKGAFRVGSVDETEWDDANIGDYSIGLGYNSIASGINSSAIGANAIASGDISTAFGSGTIASGNQSTAFGTSATASGNNSTAFGNSTTASGFTSTSFGLSTTADGYILTALGQYNIGGGNLSTWVSTDPLFDVGNGKTDSLNNAFRILKNGKTYIGDMSSTTDAIMIVDPTDSTVAVIGTLTTDHLITPDTVTLEDALKDSVVTDTLRAGRIYVDDITHMFGYFGDSSVTFSYASATTWYHLSNATDSLWLYVEKDGFTVSNDTIIMTESGDYQFTFSLSAEGSNGVTYKYRFFNVTDNTGVPVGMAMTGRGTNNIGNVTINAYGHQCSAGDRFVIQTQSDGVTSTKLRSSSIIIKKLHE